MNDAEYFWQELPDWDDFPENPDDADFHGDEDDRRKGP